EQPQLAVLSSLNGVPADQRRRGAAEIDVAALQARLVARRPVVEQAAGVAGQHQGAVAPVALAVEGYVAGRHEQVPRSRHHDDARPGPDRRVAVYAARRVEQPMHVRTERVPDMNDATGGSVDRDDVALIRRLVADVAAGPGQDGPGR